MPDDAAPRRTQEARSADTRARLIEATLRIVADLGYARAATNLIVETAGVSRGAMLHHFPAKADLMVAAAEAVYRQHLAAYGQKLHRGGSPEDRLGRLFDLAWALHQSRSTLALVEIWMASRGDPDLDARFGPFMQRTYEEGAQGLMRYLPEAGFTPEAARAWIQLFSAGFRGLAIERAMSSDPVQLAVSVALFRQLQLLALRDPKFTGQSDCKF